MAELSIISGSASTTAGGVTIRMPSVVLTNLDAFNAFYVGFANTVTTNTGFPVRPGEIFRLDVTEEQTLWVIANTTVLFRGVTYAEE